MADEVDLLPRGRSGQDPDRTGRRDRARCARRVAGGRQQSLSGLLHAVGAAYALGAPVRHGELFDGPLHPCRSRLTEQLRFLANPCESAPALDLAALPAPEVATVESAAAEPEAAPALETAAITTLDLLRQLAAERAELPLEAVSAQSNRRSTNCTSARSPSGRSSTQAAQQLGLVAPLVTVDLRDRRRCRNWPRCSTSWARPRGRRRAQPWPRSPAPVPGCARSSVELVPADRGPVAARRPTATGSCSPATGTRSLPPCRGAATGQAGRRGTALPAARLRPGPRRTDAGRRPSRADRPACRGRFVVVGDRRGAAGLAKTLHLEAPAVSTTW